MKKPTKIKAKYYSKEILKHILLAGVIIIASSSPYFVLNITKNVSRLRNMPKRKISNSFSYLKRRSLIEINKRGHDVEIRLTKAGKDLAGKYQINDLIIEKPKKWDKKWRIVIFDIPNISNLKRNIFRGKIKEFGFYALQKSVWAYPYRCEEEIRLLREFLGLDKKAIQVITADKIENDTEIKKRFKL